MMTFTFACPICKTTMIFADDKSMCPQDCTTYVSENGVWRCLFDERAEFYQAFINDYEKIRAAEGRNQHPATWYAQLPYISGQADWRIRAKSYEMLYRQVIQRATKQKLKIADFGAGNCWLSNRLASAGHQVAAIDLLTNDWDGLGANKHYDVSFAPIQAEFDHTPFTDGQFDIVIYNGAFHYSSDYAQTLREALRILKPDGVVIIMDTPVYHNKSSGQQMVKERENLFEIQYGTKSNHVPSENYLTYHRLEELREQVGLSWQIFTPYYGLKWTLKPLKAWLRGHREPAKFHVICGKRT